MPRLWLAGWWVLCLKGVRAALLVVGLCVEACSPGFFDAWTRMGTRGLRGAETGVLGQLALSVGRAGSGLATSLRPAVQCRR
mmetsp:Transcript_2882/g.6820  ORF Transcript_2882/g.6820 Transcript_2882/m.6820 type:complete len:82 (+) Transcript_2882:889-1134(+)